MEVIRTGKLVQIDQAEYAALKSYEAMIKHLMESIAEHSQQTISRLVKENRDLRAKQVEENEDE